MRYLEIVKDRSLFPGDVVQVYQNLNKSCFSVRSKRTGLVIAYADTVTVSNAIFKVSEKGRQRVLRTGVRSVHAYVEGIFLAADRTPPDCVTHVAYYNPFLTEGFMTEVSDTPIIRADIAHCQNRRVFINNSGTND